MFNKYLHTYNIFLDKIANIFQSFSVNRFGRHLLTTHVGVTKPIVNEFAYTIHWLILCSLAFSSILMLRLLMIISFTVCKCCQLCDAQKVDIGMICGTVKFKGGPPYGYIELAAHTQQWGIQGSWWWHMWPSSYDEPMRWEGGHLLSESVSDRPSPGKVTLQQNKKPGKKVGVFQ